MDKVKKFLEAHVQWVAVGLGVAFLGWMVYSYIFLKPVSSTVGNEPTAASPGEVPGIIWDGPGKKLKADLDAHDVPKEIGEMPNWYDIYLASLGKSSPSVIPVESNPWTPIPVAVDDTQGLDGGGFQHQGAKVKSLPTAPKLENLLVSGGHSNVPAPPPLVAGGTPAPQGNVAVQALDKNWRTIEATLPTAKLAESFKSVGIAPGSPFSNTCVLRVILIRNERLLDGSWGPDTEIPALEINPLMPLPPNNAAPMAQTDYQDFAEKSVVPICQPPFYQVLQGDVWYEPGTKNPNELLDAVDDGFDPRDPLSYKGDPTKLLPSEKKLYDDAKTLKDKQDALKGKSHGNTPTPPPFPPGGYPGGNPGGAPLPGGGGRGGRSGYAGDPGRPDDRDTLAPPPRRGPRPGYNPSGFDRGFPGGPPPQPQGATANPLPAGSFDPSQQPEFKVWVHDATVQAGKTYRYKMKYIISNPVARTVGLCDPQTLAQQFYIESADSAWTDPISVESDTNFYAVEMKHGVHFDVFKWKDGAWQMQSVLVNPGDMVGTIDTNATTSVKTDFTTGWTLVDIRDDPADTGNKTLVLVSDNGTVLKKELVTDAHSSGYRHLYQLANEGKAAAQAGAPSPNPN